MRQKTNKTAKMFLSLATAGACAILLSAGVALAEVDKGSADMVLQTTQAKKPSIFPHAKHQEFMDCADCHHGKNEDGTKKAYVEGEEVGKCVSCHNSEDMTNKKLNNFKTVAHLNCKDCHKEQAKAGKVTGPTKCAGCHT